MCMCGMQLGSRDANTPEEMLDVAMELKQRGALQEARGVFVDALAGLRVTQGEEHVRRVHGPTNLSTPPRSLLTRHIFCSR
jgi:hypothetical protein